MDVLLWLGSWLSAAVCFQGNLSCLLHFQNTLTACPKPPKTFILLYLTAKAISASLMSKWGCCKRNICLSGFFLSELVLNAQQILCLTSWRCPAKPGQVSLAAGSRAVMWVCVSSSWLKSSAFCLTWLFWIEYQSMKCYLASKRKENRLLFHIFLCYPGRFWWLGIVSFQGGFSMK